MEFVASANEAMPLGRYPVELTDIVLDEEGKFGKQYKWELRVFSGEYADTKLCAWTSVSVKIGSKFTTYAGAFLGRSIQDGERFTKNQLIGCKAFADVIIKTKDDGTEVNKVIAIVPPKKKAPAAPPPPPVVDDPFASPADDDDPFSGQ